MRGELNRHGMRGGTRKKGEGAAWSSSCSRNAHDENVLVRRAHLRIDQAALREIGEQAWKDRLDG